MATSQRPRGLGLYYIARLPRANRIDDTRATHRDSNPLPVVTAADVAHELDRRLSDTRATQLRDVSDAYLSLTLIMPEGHS